MTVGQVLLTVDDVTRRGHYRNAYRTFAKLLELGVVPIVNENDTVATSEIRFGDNDRLAALVAHLVHADLLLLLSDVDGLYDGDPTAARRHADLRGRAATADLADVGIGRPGAAARAPAAWDQGRGRPDRHRRRDPGRADRAPSRPPAALAGEHRRHALPPHRSPPADPAALAGARDRAAGPAGARRRRGPRGHRATGLPAAGGHHRGRRRFTAGDPVDLVDARRGPVARGLVNYDAAELPGLLGRSTRELARELGAAYEREVVHRDDLVLLRADLGVPGRHPRCTTPGRCFGSITPTDAAGTARARGCTRRIDRRGVSQWSSCAGTGMSRVTLAGDGWSRSWCATRCCGSVTSVPS